MLTSAKKGLQAMTDCFCFVVFWNAKGKAHPFLIVVCKSHGCSSSKGFQSGAAIACTVV
jgi:hypothetical protein